MATSSIRELIEFLSTSQREGLLTQWAVQCAEALQVDGVAVTLLGGPGRTTPLSPFPLLASNALAARLEDLQYQLREGPGVEAIHHHEACLEPDLAAARRRWPTFAPAALQDRARALFAMPLPLKGTHTAALTCHRLRPGGIGRQAFVDIAALLPALSALADTTDLRLPSQVS
ncbi:hypothetical protein [Streptacidiphilus sp. PAMC 29251]